MNVYDVIRRPVVTEKSSMLMDRQHKYAFEVADNASKAQIKEAVEVAFKVGVTGVNVVAIKGKVKRYGRRPTPQRSWKKAIVTLREGDKIELFESA